MSRSRRALVVASVVVVVGAGTAGLIYASGHDGATAQAAEPEDTAPSETAAVERRDLVRTEEVDGTVTYGDRSTLKGAGGTVTALPPPGTVIGRGTALWEEDGAPGPILLEGARPLWRTLSTAADDGPDVRQLEENLVALGFADPARLTVDDEFTGETARAVKRWQKSLGREETGRVEPGDVIFQPGPVRVAQHSVAVGDASEGAVMEVTGTTRRVHVDLDAADAAMAAVGSAVEVQLADGSNVEGTIASVGTTAEVQEGEAGADSTTTIDVDIDLAAEVSALDESPVEVSLVSSRAEGVLAVPVQALLALAEGGYAIERVGAAGTELVPVTLGAYADDWVEVEGDLAEGDQVVLA